MKNPLKSIFYVIIVLSISCTNMETNNQAEIVNLEGLENLYQVNTELYRSEQPSNSEMEALEKLGLKTILNLRQFHSDDDEAKNTSLKLERVKINTWTISYEEVIESLKIIHKSEKPVLVHCKHGSDRTGCVVAASRMVFDGWTKEEAIKEFSEEKFGFHDKYFPNILELLENIDIEELKKSIQN